MNTMVKTNHTIVKLKKFLQEKVGGRKDFALFIKSKLLELGCDIQYIGDVGCGAGTVAMELATLLPESTIYGFDVNDHFGASNLDHLNNFTYINFESYHLSKQNIKLDAVVLGGVLHHIPKEHTRDFLDDISDSMSESGIIIVHEHRLSDLKVRRCIELGQLALLETLCTKTLEGMLCSYNFYMKDTLIKTFENSGFELIESLDTNGKFVTTPTINGNTVFFFKNSCVNLS